MEVEQLKKKWRTVPQVFANISYHFIRFNFSTSPHIIANLNLLQVKDVQVGHLIGAGNFGEVYRGRAFGGTLEVALKKLKGDIKEEFIAELEVLR